MSLAELRAHLGESRRAMYSRMGFYYVSAAIYKRIVEAAHFYADQGIKV